EDLYYRLLGLPIALPPLRDRGNDIIVLAKHFADEFCKENKLKKKSFSQDAQRKMLSYPYPGNIRELKAVVELGVVMADSDVIQAEDLTFTSSDSLSEFLLQETTLKNYTTGIIQHFLDKYNGNVLLVAEKLDIGKSTIYRMIQQSEVIVK
ncbi:MAG: sigma-54-dependent Fis family transcriptional regulator, partial [Hymenobacteraceae bacterium]|nr:sigma-54-dependent Fis family transcriptional regulator [Hymenobacteraceae bacterium]MDX5394602.1 sigma-54-dependent Fis family transcriptional regulator [Hymenobacteraceae bacterium]MDX5510630.1 sigma-54-dependent Fis family transcriptional regulator [Hymenobacteraceae bacterium]